jgi:predicted ABC-type ATPase
MAQATRMIRSFTARATDRALKRPTLYMLAGPNGAGKSTLYEARLRPVLKGVPFINADIIQRNELADPSMQASYKAAEIAETRRARASRSTPELRLREHLLS